ncbi:MAG: hypothetical protein A2Y45_05500 [Tenericutes bacterium GWC2_34_14]|nr:MAG: hypothetical protein A2Y45_05500 [Tenericutes bacterium GWC2_34_14]OHE33683.1 MAG: hypothetical protein A2012_04310 [Tenericutes bacterium GWE2_34_108]OHE36968.1 MAG: hypothetical protein A2Y46_10110 [Tenericutes bacterium GWF1_35_14]OHE37952.1 MAG: hypothetical protein A2Y44_08555 [Tenericutes bacterium GWF2_35_184]OHE41129.1 MAG: hypothetical protein A3K26_01560 [Tenericutes bacterium RIFOXYA12_FULL_35_10]OHE43531.1 MAG: hypothetical protein A2221_07180 [Tenericutes bacterium RIFOXYA
MKLLLSKKGIGLPAVLAIVAFVLGTTATFLSYIFFQARLSDIQIEESEAYANAVSNVKGALYMIARDQNLDEIYLLQLEELMNVDIVLYGTNLYTVSSRSLVGSKTVQSYITGSVTSLDTYDSIFQYTGEEPTFNLSPMVTPSNLAASYLPTYIETNFPWITPETTFTDFQSVVDYIRELAIAQNGFNYYQPSALETQWDPTAWWHWYIDGSVTIPKNKNLTVPDGRMLVIDGDLTMNENSTIYGNVIVNGNVTLIGKGNSVESIQGTLYISGNLTTAKSTLLGSIDRPTFVFAEGSITLGNNTTGYGYFLSNDFTAQQGNIYITGGVYTTLTPTLQNEVLPNPDLSYEDFYDYGIPEEVSIESTDPVEGEIGFIFTTPKLS